MTFITPKIKHGFALNVSFKKNFKNIVPDECFLPLYKYTNSIVKLLHNAHGIFFYLLLIYSFSYDFYCMSRYTVCHSCVYMYIKKITNAEDKCSILFFTIKYCIPLRQVYFSLYACI